MEGERFICEKSGACILLWESGCDDETRRGYISYAALENKNM